jgi:hypothetical protein
MFKDLNKQMRQEKKAAEEKAAVEKLAQEKATQEKAPRVEKNPWDLNIDFPVNVKKVASEQPLEKSAFDLDSPME